MQVRNEFTAMISYYVQIEADIYKVMSRYSRIRGFKIPYLIQHSLNKRLEII